jgi:nitroreductase
VKADDLLDRVEAIRGGDRPVYVPPAFFLKAPVVIAVATAGGAYRTKPDLLMLETGSSEMEVLNHRSRGDLQTLGAVIQLILLAAWERGLGGCWMTGPLFARSELEYLLGLGQGGQLAALVPLGRPAVIPDAKGRRAVEDVMKFL